MIIIFFPLFLEFNKPIHQTLIIRNFQYTPLNFLNSINSPHLYFIYQAEHNNPPKSSLDIQLFLLQKKKKALKPPQKRSAEHKIPNPRDLDVRKEVMVQEKEKGIKGIKRFLRILLDELWKSIKPLIYWDLFFY